MNNLQAAAMNLEFKPNVPLMTPAQFSKETGLSKSTVSDWMDKELLPTFTLQQKTPKNRPKRLINMMKLFDACKEGGAK